MAARWGTFNLHRPERERKYARILDGDGSRDGSSSGSSSGTGTDSPLQMKRTLLLLSYAD